MHLYVLWDTLVCTLCIPGANLYITRNMKLGSTFQEAVLAAFRSGIFSVWYTLFCMLSAGLTSWGWEEEREVSKRVCSSPIFFSLLDPWLPSPVMS